MIEKTNVIGGLDLPEKAEHARERGLRGKSCEFMHILYVA